MPPPDTLTNPTLNRRPAGAALAVAGFLARVALRSPAGMKVIRAAPWPAKRLVVDRLSLTGRSSSERTRIGRVLYDLDLRDPFQRSLYFNALERRSLRLALRLVPEGGIFVDAGSCIGYYALNLARKVGSAGAVHAFEPESTNFERLTANCILNGMDGRVRVNRVALSNRSGKARLFRQQGCSAEATLARFAEDWPASEPVSVQTLDTYLACRDLTHINLAKVDVGGHELEVLEGASATLKANAISNLLVSFHGTQAEHHPRDLVQFLGEHGYAPAARHRILVGLLLHGFVWRKRPVNLLFRPERRWR